ERCRIKAQERIGGEKNEKQEGGRQKTLHAQRRAGQTRSSALQARHQRGIDGQYQHPEQHGAFVIAPHAADFVDQWLQGVAVAGDIQDRKIRDDEGIGQGTEGQRHKDEQAEGGTDCHATRRDMPFFRAEQPRHRHHQRQRQSKAKRQLAKLSGHCDPSCQRPLFFRACTTSGGIYFSSCLARTSVATKVPLLSMEPVAITPWPSRNRAGSTPLKSAGTVLLPSVTRNRTCAPSPWWRLPFSTSPPMRNATPG